MKFSKQVNLKALLKLLVKAKPSVVAIKACVSVQYFARTMQSFGHEVILPGPLCVGRVKKTTKDAIATEAVKKPSRALIYEKYFR